MHRTLKKRTASPPKSNLRTQQYRFDQFRRIYNQERPHEALNMETPASVYRPSSRPFPEKPEPLSYPGHFEIRRVSQDSTIRWNCRKVFGTSTLRRHHIGLEQISDRVWSVYFGPIHLGWLDEADYRIMDVKNRKSRRR